MGDLGHWSIITKNNRIDVVNALIEIAMHDADFCGDNGYEYLWDEAKGFECNSEYALSIAENEPTIVDTIKKFVAIWMDGDGYYVDYDLAISELNDTIAISIAYITD